MRVLFSCNSIYQVLISIWIKKSLFDADCVDIIISDHMNDYERISEKLKECGYFNKVFSVATKALCKKGLTTKERYRCIVSSSNILRHYISLNEKYDVFFAANLNVFTKLVFHTIKNDKGCRVYNKNIKFCLFEDGMSTYSKLFERYYKNCKYSQKYTKLFYHPKTIYNNLSEIYAFDTNAFMWQTEGAELKAIPKIDIADKDFIKTANAVFGYDDMSDTYDKKYIFMEESFYADTGYNDDVELIEKIASKIGKENIMIKIHPRNPVNRFEKLGYKTNKNTAIPWEVILMNNDFSDKILLTVASSSVMSPAFLFGQKIETYVMYELLNEKPKALVGDLWECSKNRFKMYGNIKIIGYLNEII